MAMRTLRVCDTPSCSGAFVAVCPLCDQDCCSVHIGASSVAVRIAIVVGERPLGTSIAGICSACCGALAVPVPPVMPDLLGNPFNAFPAPPSGMPAALPPGVPGPYQPATPFPPPPPLPLDHMTEAFRPLVLEAIRAFMADKALGKVG